mgnify:CR=1 FL=1
MSDTKKLDRLLRELDKTTAEVLRQTFEDLTKENARLKERIDQLEKNVTAFAGQLESWGFDAAAKQIRSEIGGDVEAPNFYKLRAENARLKGVLREIRDLARTGLKPDIYPTEEIWLQHKINQIASMAHACIGKETTIN